MAKAAARHLEEGWMAAESGRFDLGGIADVEFRRSILSSWLFCERPAGNMIFRPLALPPAAVITDVPVR